MTSSPALKVFAVFVVIVVLMFRKKIGINFIAAGELVKAKTTNMGVFTTNPKYSVRGLRNNNPGNIEKGIGWNGEVPLDQNTEPRFAQFWSMKFGVRAMYKLVGNYIIGKVGDRTEKFNTVRKLITRWAPPIGTDENGAKYSQDTNAYINQVANKVGISADTVIQPWGEVHKQIMVAMMAHENGGKTPTSTEINEGIQLL